MAKKVPETPKTAKATAAKTKLQAAKKVVIPKKLELCVDRLFTIRDDRKILKAQLDKLEAEESALREHLIENISVKDTAGVMGKVAKAMVERRDVPVAKDWDAIHSYIKKTGNFGLLQRRLNEGAVKELWEAKKKVPGVDTFVAKSISVTKI